MRSFLLGLFVCFWMVAPAGAVQTEAGWTGALDFIVPFETTPDYEGQRLGGWGGDAGDHQPRRYDQAIDHVLVFVHGNSRDAADWDDYRVYFRDRGFNDSALWALSWCGGKPDLWYDIFTEGNSTDLTVFLEAVAAYTGVAKARLVVHSQGGSMIKDVLYEHPPAGVMTTHLSSIAVPNGDKSSAQDAGAAICLNWLWEGNAWCTQEFGATVAAQDWRDARVLADPALAAIQVIYAGSITDASFYLNANEDVRFSPRDNMVSTAWSGQIEYSQHADQDHRQLRYLNIGEVFDFITDPVAPVCGNGVAESGETCDGTDLAGASCASLGFSGGTLACNGDCQSYDSSACTDAELCGDDVCAGAAAGEDCHSCLADCPGKTGGTPTRQFCCGNGICEAIGEDAINCPVDCALAPPECGNGTAEAGEECDGADLGGESCENLGFDCGGDLVCNPDCTLNSLGCSSSTCGDDLAECGETCDGNDLAQESCQSLGYESGSLFCDSDCQDYDTSACLGGAICGDDICAGSAEGEDCLTCKADCPGKTGGTPTKLFCCGNGTCEPVGEDTANCPIDCP